MSAFLPPITERAQTMRSVYDQKLSKTFGKPASPSVPAPDAYMLPWHIQMHGALGRGGIQMSTQGWQLRPASMRHRPVPPPPQSNSKSRHASVRTRM